MLYAKMQREHELPGDGDHPKAMSAWVLLNGEWPTAFPESERISRVTRKDHDACGRSCGKPARRHCRFTAWILVDVLFHTIILGTGYLVLSVLAPKKEPSENNCAAAGLIT